MSSEIVVGGGLWRCLAPKGCERAATGSAFSGPTQADAQKETVKLRCPDCGGAFIMYAGERSKEEDHGA